MFLFRKRGFDGTPVSEIAGALGMSKAGVYHHFRTKDDILRDLLNPLFDQVEELLNHHQPAPNGSPGQRRLLEEYFDLILDNRQLVALLANDAAVISHPEIEARMKELNDRLLEMVAGLEASLEGQLRAGLALGVLQFAVIRFFQADPDTVREQGLRAAAKILEEDR